MPIQMGIPLRIRKAKPHPFAINRDHVVGEEKTDRGWTQIACSCGTVITHCMINPGDPDEFWYAVKKHGDRDNVRWTE